MNVNGKVMVVGAFLAAMNSAPKGGRDGDVQPKRNRNQQLLGQKARGKQRDREILANNFNKGYKPKD